MKTNILFLIPLIVISTSSISQAHNGRRFEIKIDDGQLVTEGYLSGPDPSDDGGGLIRPYYNALHDHWGNVGPVATATLPGFDLHTPAGLMGYGLSLDLIGAGKWTDPANNTHGGHGGLPVLSELDANETIYIGFGNQPDFDTDNIDPNDPDSFQLAENIAGSVTDIDLEYSIFINPINTLYYLQWELSTNAPGIAASDPIYTILSPDPDVGGLHHASLALESHLGIVSAPEPSASILLSIGTIGALTRRRR